MAKFSSDRSVVEYAEKIWDIKVLFFFSRTHSS